MRLTAFTHSDTLRLYRRRVANPGEVEKRIAQLPPGSEGIRALSLLAHHATVRCPARPGPHLRDTATISGRKVSRQARSRPQLRSIENAWRLAEIERWNRILTAEKPVFNTNPNAFLVEMIKNCKSGTAVDVGMGRGCNAVWLAQQGWDVTGFDPVAIAVALANQAAEKLGVHLKTEKQGERRLRFRQESMGPRQQSTKAQIYAVCPPVL